MYCTGCGTELEYDALFCRECGKKVEPTGKAIINAQSEDEGGRTGAGTAVSKITTDKKSLKRINRFGTGFYLVALLVSIMLPLYIFLFKNRFFRSIPINTTEFYRYNAVYISIAALLVLSCIFLKVSRIPALITLLPLALSQYTYIDIYNGRYTKPLQDPFTLSRLFGTLAAFLFFMLTIKCKGIIRNITCVLTMTLFGFLTFLSFMLGLHEYMSGGYVFVGFRVQGLSVYPPFYYFITFLTYTVISMGMLTLGTASKKDAVNPDEKSPIRRKKTLSYAFASALTVLISVATVILFSRYNLPENRFTRIVALGDEQAAEKYYLLAVNSYRIAARLNPDDPDVYIAMLKASGKCLNPDEILSSYEMAVENLGRKDLKNITEKAWKLIGDLEDDFRDAGRDEDYWTLVNDFRSKVVAADVEIDLSWNRPWGYTTAAAPTAPVPAAPAGDTTAAPVQGEPVTVHVFPTAVEAEPVHDGTGAVPEDGTNYIDEYFRINPDTGFFTMDTGLFGKSFTEMSELLGELDPLEYWPHWGDNLYVTFLTDDVNTFALLFQNNVFVCCYYDIPEDGRIPDNISVTARDYFGKECDSITNPYGDGFTYFYNWILPGYYYEQYSEMYSDETHFRQRYSTVQIYPM